MAQGAVTEGSTSKGGNRRSRPVTHLDLVRLVERVHRRYLDLLRGGLVQLGVDDISPAQVLLLLTIGDDELSVRDLLERGNYLGSNASYNLKQLVEAAYIDREVSSRDRRSAVLRLAPKGKELCEKVRVFDRDYHGALARDPAVSAGIETTFHTLRRLELMWMAAMQDGEV